jgi:hypothetical protein
MLPNVDIERIEPTKIHILNLSALSLRALNTQFDSPKWLASGTPSPRDETYELLTIFREVMQLPFSYATV